MVAPFGNSFSTNSPCASPPFTLSAPTWPMIPVTDGTRRSTVTTGTLASIASCSAGAIASTSFGESTTPLTPLASAASMSAVCLGEDIWPSPSIVSRPCWSAAALKAFIIWTKNGKFMPGTEMRMSGLSAAKAGAASVIASRLAVKTRRVMRMDCPPWGRPDMLAGGAAPCPKSGAATRED